VVRLTSRSVDRIIKDIVTTSGLSSEVTAYAIWLAGGVHMLDKGADLNVVADHMGIKGGFTLDVLKLLSTAKVRLEMEKTHPRGSL
jgi:site-specific recombinase XerD